MLVPKSVTNHSAIIHPPGFYIIGFKSFSYISAYIFFLVFVYLVTVVFNGLLMYIIAMDNKLHTPKFLAVVNLAVIDALLNTSTIPGMVKTFVLNDNFVPFNLCLVQMFIHYSCICLESYALAILAYDRVIAISFPFRQNVLNTRPIMFTIIGLTWCYSVGLLAYSTIIMTRLSFCRSVTVFSYFCDYAPVFRLACNDYSLHWAVATVSLVNLIAPFIFIVFSYVTIIMTVFRMKSVTSRMKALTTCIEHLILVTIFYFPLFIIYFVGLLIKSVNPDQRVLSLSLATCLPPCINPIVYSLKTKEIRTRAVQMVRKLKINP